MERLQGTIKEAVDALMSCRLCMSKDSGPLPTEEYITALPSTLFERVYL